MRSGAQLFVLNFVQFFIIVANTRAYTQGHYFWTAVTDMALCIIGFTVTKRIAESKSWQDRIGFALGGTLGAQAAIYITKLIYGM